MTEENHIEEPNNEDENPLRMELRQSVRHFYDFQRLRIQSSNRASSQTAQLSEDHQKSMSVQGWLLENLEKEGLKEINRLLKKWPIYTDWLKAQKGVGPTMAGVLLAEIDIRRCETPSALWAYCGLAVKNGEAQRRKKGEKCGYNPWLKSKVVKVLAESFIKSKSPWRDYYDSYKHRKQHTLVKVCMACNGEGKIKGETCGNCEGRGGQCPWGRSDAHRHMASLRYMAKMFLLEFWKQWRTMEGLSVVEPYSVAVLGREHGDHGGMGDQLTPNRPVIRP